MATENDYVAEYSDEVTEIPEKPTEEPSKETEEPVKATEEETSPNNEQEEESVDPNELIEDQARQQGWVPFDEWNGDPKEWRPADVFLERGEYFRTMKSQKRQIESLTNQMNELVNMQNKIRSDERQKTISELKRQKAEAMENQDFQRVMDIDEELDRNKEEEIKEKYDNSSTSSNENSEQLSTTEQELVDNWLSKNDWYNKDEELREEADSLGVGYRSRNPNATLQDVLNYVDKRMASRKPTPTQENNSNKSSSPVATSTTTTTPRSSKKKKGWNDLSDDQKAIGKRFVEAGAFDTVEQYIAELEKIGDL